MIHVPPQLPRRTPCKLACVAEAPADYEVIDCKPLVGPSGRIYDRLLRMAGVDRDDILTTNVMDIQAPDNDIDKLLVGKKDIPEAAWEAGYDLLAFNRSRYLPVHLLPQLDRLKAEIEACSPNVVICMGGFSLWAFTGISEIKTCRGAAMKATRLVPGQKIVATYHPAFTFHDPRVFPLIAMDFNKAVAEAETREVTYVERTVTLEPDLMTINDFFDTLLIDDILAIDIETIPRSRMIKCIAFSPRPDRALVVPFVDSRQTARSYWPTSEAEVLVWEAVARICAHPCQKVMQNGLYDFRYLYDRGIAVLNYRRDTRLAHHALFPELPKDLGSLGACFTNDRPWKMYRGGRDGRKRDE